MDGQQLPDPVQNQTIINKPKRSRGFSKKQLLIFAGLFAAVGVYLLVRSFAATFTNETELLAAFKGLGTNRPSKVVTSISETYKGNTAFKSASILATTSFAQNGGYDTVGSLSLQKVVASKTLTHKYTFEQKSTWGANYIQFNNISGLIKDLPSGNSLRSFLELHGDMIARIDNKWNYIYHGYYDDSTPGLPGFKCLAGTSLVPASGDVSTIRNAYINYPPLSINKDSKGTYTIAISNQRNLSLFVNAASNTSYISTLNNCSLSAFNSNASGKLIDATGVNSLTGTVSTISKVINQITLKTDGPKSTTTVTSNFTYGTYIPYVQYPN